MIDRPKKRPSAAGADRRPTKNRELKPTKKRLTIPAASSSEKGKQNAALVVRCNEVKIPTSSSAKSAYALRTNIRLLDRSAGGTAKTSSAKVGFYTFTLPSRLDASEVEALAQRFDAKPFRALLKACFSEWIAVFHRGENEGQRWHAHVIAVRKDETREQTLANRVGRAGFGISRGDAVWSTAGNVGAYFQKGLDASRSFAEGKKMVRYCASANRVTMNFSWLGAGRDFRKWLSELSQSLGGADKKYFAAALGSRWSGQLWWLWDNAKDKSHALGIAQRRIKAALLRIEANDAFQDNESKAFAPEHSGTSLELDASGRLVRVELCASVEICRPTAPPEVNVKVETAQRRSKMPGCRPRIATKIRCGRRSYAGCIHRSYGQARGPPRTSGSGSESSIRFRLYAFVRISPVVSRKLVPST